MSRVAAGCLGALLLGACVPSQPERTRVDALLDGVACADLHELGASQNVPDQPGALLTENWTSAGISSSADVCVQVTLSKSGGAPAVQQSGDMDAIEWRAQ